MTDNEINIPPKLELVRASEVTPKEVQWLWYPYIPFGKVTLLQGDPGDGKSKLMLPIAALLSRGEQLPFVEEAPREPMTVIYQTTEDDADDTVVQWFNASGGDGERLIFIKEDEKTLTFGDDRIEEAILRCSAKLLILDPMSSYIGSECSMNSAIKANTIFTNTTTANMGQLFMDICFFFFIQKIPLTKLVSRLSGGVIIFRSPPSKTPDFSTTDAIEMSSAVSPEAGTITSPPRL